MMTLKVFLLMVLAGLVVSFALDAAINAVLDGYDRRKDAKCRKEGI